MDRVRLGCAGNNNANRRAHADVELRSGGRAGRKTGVGLGFEDSMRSFSLYLFSLDLLLRYVR